MPVTAYFSGTFFSRNFEEILLWKRFRGAERKKSYLIDHQAFLLNLRQHELIIEAAGNLVSNKILLILKRRQREVLARNVHQEHFSQVL